MTKPQPIAEIAINPPHEVGQVYHIYVASQDAYDWIAQNAAGFGNLFEPNETCKYFALFISPLYNVSEVLTYLKSYNEGNND